MSAAIAAASGAAAGLVPLAVWFWFMRRREERSAGRYPCLRSAPLRAAAPRLALHRSSTHQPH
jgi:hypothetical protein